MDKDSPLKLLTYHKTKKMKATKKILAVIMIAILSVGVAEAKLRFGIKAGLNVNDIHLNDPMKTFESDNGTGWTAGIMTQYISMIGLGFDASVMYTRMNADVYFEGGTENLDADNHNFIEIPINLKYRIGLPVVGNIISPYIFTGPSFAFKLGKDTIDEFKTKTCQVAWNLGLGIELFRHLQVGASYGFGINNVVSKVPVGINAEDYKAKNNYWTITAAYLF